YTTLFRPRPQQELQLRRVLPLVHRDRDRPAARERRIAGRPVERAAGHLAVDVRDVLLAHLLLARPLLPHRDVDDRLDLIERLALADHRGDLGPGPGEAAILRLEERAPRHSTVCG